MRQRHGIAAFTLTEQELEEGWQAWQRGRTLHSISQALVVPPKALWEAWKKQGRPVQRDPTKAVGNKAWAQARKLGAELGMTATQVMWAGLKLVQERDLVGELKPRLDSALKSGELAEAQPKQLWQRAGYKQRQFKHDHVEEGST